MNLIIVFLSNFYSTARLASGTTWQSSGQVLHMQNSVIETHFVKYSRQLYEKLHKEGHDIGNSILRLAGVFYLFSLSTGFSEKGSLWVAKTSDRLHTLKRQYAIIKALGINCEILNVENFKEKIPIIDPHEIWVCRLIVCLAHPFCFLCRVVCGYTMISWLIPFRLLWPLLNSPSKRVWRSSKTVRQRRFSPKSNELDNTIGWRASSRRRALSNVVYSLTVQDW